MSPASNISLPKDLELQQSQFINEKHVSQPNPRSNLRWFFSFLLTIGTFSLIMFTTVFRQGKFNVITEVTENAKLQQICPLGSIIRPQAFLQDNSSLEHIFHDSEYRLDTTKKLSGAVKIPTVAKIGSNPSDESEYEEWDNFVRFHRYLEAQFPELYQTLQVEKLNRFGLLITWKGTSSTDILKPLLLMAHQDVVPIEPATVDQWLYPPFSGEWDDQFLYGRGSSDCKSLVIGYFQAFTKLIQDGFKPQRTVIIALGFDEEIGGSYGAVELANVVRHRYGPDSLFAVLDEGGSSIQLINDGDLAVALPSIGEKGGTNLDIELTTPGGHSSIPPDHTNIGIVADLITVIENDPFPGKLGPKNPTLNHLQCIAKYSTEFDEQLRSDIFNAGKIEDGDSGANSRVIEYLSGIRSLKYNVRTTQAIDIIHGGVKSNALPEYTKITINHRVGFESTVEETIEKIVKNVQTVAKKYQLGLSVVNEAEGAEQTIFEETPNGKFQVLVGFSLKPSRVSPVDNDSFDIFRGTIKHIIKDYVYPDLPSEPVVAGNLNSGNTDTRHYMDLSENIYRFKFSTLNGLVDGGTHGLNEKVKIDDLLGLIGFIYEYVRNVDEFEEY
ncbi:hypothetical protein WICPIJ_007824 [Wickerhamomyces pijperi]|uniref:Peptidase M20 dimerisation domain-containing protein n=1 Tax=Wickerhamomyces pijperi TaxID=599730 RepID=A0A9P8TJK1_WICPI|nr:hypothetical protein WICPIJ_007824 [Wickerhamomyces pijperi]